MVFARARLNEAFSQRIAKAFLREEQIGLGFAMWVRIAALSAIAAWLLYIVPMPRVLFWLGIIVLFLALSIAPLVARQRWRRWRAWVAGFAVLDAALLCIALLAPNPLETVVWPLQMQLRFHDFLYFFVLLAGAALSYSPILVLITGVASAIAWSVGVHIIFSQPETKTPESFPGPEATDAERLVAYLDPTFVDLTRWQNEIVLLLIVTAIIAAAVWRSRRLVLRQAAAERAQTNLARYFSPDVVAQLSEADAPLETAETRQVAVIFVDIVGFTSLAEDLPPERVIALLRSFHRRMANCVFENGGTLDKYVGDSVMATFGSVNPGQQEATRALRCAGAMLDQVTRWNAKRAARGAREVRIGIGIHHGPVVVGNIGDDRCLEFTVIGDTVNVASRLERMTRNKQVPLVISDQLIAAVRQDGAIGEEDLKDFVAAEPVTLPGRRTTVPIWCYQGTRQDEAPAAIEAHGPRPSLGNEESQSEGAAAQSTATPQPEAP